MQKYVASHWFDSQWYLTRYPDVARAGMDPWRHFVRFGRFEDRLPYPSKAAELEYQLWFDSDPDVIPELEKIASDTSCIDGQLASWLLARYYGSVGNWQSAAQLLRDLERFKELFEVVAHPGPFLVLFESLLEEQRFQDAMRILSSPNWPKDKPAFKTDWQLAQSRLHNSEEKRACINAVFKTHGLLPIKRGELTLDTLLGESGHTNFRWWQRTPLVSVIIPCFNAEETLTTAVESLLRQTYVKLEIIIVDDASTDNSIQVARKLAARDRRVRVLPQSENGGAYRVRNVGLQEAKGQLLTTHDSDDWSHPQKIELQVRHLMQHRHLMGCRSHWVRCDESLQFTRWRVESSWVYPNISSFMFRRSVFEKLGYWDRVSVNADSEYYERVQAAYGTNAVGDVLPGVPLAFGRSDDASLSQTKATHLRTQFKGVRRDYQLACQRWHSENSAKDLYLPFEPDERPFPVPLQICRGGGTLKQHRLASVLNKKQWFDENYYCKAYPDVAKADIEPIRHFIRFGCKEGRDPNNWLSVSGYGYLLGMPLMNVIPALAELESELPKLNFKGDQLPRKNKKNMLVVGHQASCKLFGAERSLLDCLEMLADDYNLVVTLPGLGNSSYLKRLQQYVSEIHVFPYYWWWKGREPDSYIQERFVELIKAHSMDAVYVNTIVLWEPVLAGQQCEVPVVVHAREYPPEDRALCATLNATATQIAEHCSALNVSYITNSSFAAGYLPLNTHVVSNTVDEALFALDSPKSSKQPVVALISSNIEKKGIRDFAELAKLSAKKQLPFKMVAFGPRTDMLAQLLAETSDFSYGGYYENVRDILEQVDIVVNLSHFAESFGRTVLEAQAAARPVVVYTRGALPERVKDASGLAVAPDDIEQVLACLSDLLDPEAFEAFSQQGRKQALNYRKPVVSERLKAVMRQCIQSD
ncbi:glycosyltransferase [Idiomarina sp.]|uniref:glycosyltransferase n=1 Tax=Idiomarina sp. TaxID=1874361 RepID=UPI003518D879